MGLTNALYTGLSGLNVNQTTMNVVGNNIANVNTTAFKASTALFSPDFYVTDQAGSAPAGNFGGTNPSQEGLGAQVSSIATDWTPGAIASTGVNTNMAIDGQGFFITNSGAAGTQYTRDGTFTLNSNHQLVNSTGSFVQGFGVDTSGNVVLGAISNITIPLGQTTIAQATQNVTMQGNLNAAGPVASGASILTSQAFTTNLGTVPDPTTNLVDLMSTAVPPAPLVSAGDVLTLNGTIGSRQLTSSSLTITPTTTLGDLQNFINDSYGIDTTVNEAGNPTPGATLQTAGTTAQLTIIGNTGSQNALTIGSNGLQDATNGTTPFAITAGTDGAFTSNPTGESTNTTITAYDSLGTPITVNMTTVLESESSGTTTWRFYATSPDATGANGPIVGDGTLTFNSSGKLTSSSNATLTIPRTGTGAASPLVMNLDFSGTTALTSTSSQMIMGAQDGLPIGTLSTFSIGEDGTIIGEYTNGQTKTLAQVAVASFNNPEGLVNNGGNNFTAGASSGVPVLATPGTLGTGLVLSGSLEESNVDISKQFIDLIVASTGFSAASKVISTSDQLLTNLLNQQT